MNPSVDCDQRSPLELDEPIFKGNYGDPPSSLQGWNCSDLQPADGAVVFGTGHPSEGDVLNEGMVSGPWVTTTRAKDADSRDTGDQRLPYSLRLSDARKYGTSSSHLRLHDHQQANHKQDTSEPTKKGAVVPRSLQKQGEANVHPSHVIAKAKLPTEVGEWTRDAAPLYLSDDDSAGVYECMDTFLKPAKGTKEIPTVGTVKMGQEDGIVPGRVGLRHGMAAALEACTGVSMMNGPAFQQDVDAFDTEMARRHHDVMDAVQPKEEVHAIHESQAPEMITLRQTIFAAPLAQEEAPANHWPPPFVGAEAGGPEMADLHQALVAAPVVPEEAPVNQRPLSRVGAVAGWPDMLVGQQDVAPAPQPQQEAGPTSNPPLIRQGSGYLQCSEARSKTFHGIVAGRLRMDNQELCVHGSQDGKASRQGMQEVRPGLARLFQEPSALVTSGSKSSCLPAAKAKSSNVEDHTLRLLDTVSSWLNEPSTMQVGLKTLETLLECQGSHSEQQRHVVSKILLAGTTPSQCTDNRSRYIHQRLMGLMKSLVGDSSGGVSVDHLSNDEKSFLVQKALNCFIKAVDVDAKVSVAKLNGAATSGVSAQNGHVEAGLAKDGIASPTKKRTPPADERAAVEFPARRAEKPERARKTRNWTQIPMSAKVDLSDRVDLGPMDCILGRGGNNSHCGNRKYRELAMPYQEDYKQAQQAEFPHKATRAVLRLVLQVLKQHNIRFVAEVNGEYYTVLKSVVDIKVTELLRSKRKSASPRAKAFESAG